MAVQAGCGFKPPTPVFAAPLPVSGEPPRRLGVTSAPPRDAGSDVMMGGGRLSGQWVTLSKALLLQLVERICQLSFQNDVMPSSSASPPLCRKFADELGPDVEIKSFRQRSSSTDGGKIPSERASENDNGQDITKGVAAAEESETPPVCRHNAVSTLPDFSQTISGSVESPADERLPAASCYVDEQNSTVELDMVEAGSSVDREPPAEFGGTATGAGGRGPSDAAASDANHPDERRRRRQHRQRSVCRRRLLRGARRRKKAALATTSGGQVRCEALTGGGRRGHLHGVQRRRQSWMALSKDIVYGAVESELRHVDASRRSLVSVAKSTAAIWNPATCLSPSEKQRSRPPVAARECTPAATGTRYRGNAFRQPGSDVVRRPRDATLTGSSSSMLSELLGFGAATPTVVLPAEVAVTRQRHCSYGGGGGESSVCSVVSPSSVSGSGVKSRPRGDHAHARSVSDSPSHSDVTTALDYCVRRDTGGRQSEVGFSAVPRIWRPVESYPAIQSIGRCVARPRWVAVDKGDVCSLVDNLVSTMIASEDRGVGTATGGRPGDVRDASTTTAQSAASSSSPTKPALPVTARCSVAASEPRKWKSDLLQRMRNEDT